MTSPTSPDLHDTGEGSSSFAEPSRRPDTPNSDIFDGDDLTDLNLDKALLNEDPLSEDSDNQSVIQSGSTYRDDTIADETEDIVQAKAETSLRLIAA